MTDDSAINDLRERFKRVEGLLDTIAQQHGDTRGLVHAMKVEIKGIREDVEEIKEERKAGRRIFLTALGSLVAGALLMILTVIGRWKGLEP